MGVVVAEMSEQIRYFEGLKVGKDQDEKAGAVLREQAEKLRFEVDTLNELRVNRELEIR